MEVIVVIRKYDYYEDSYKKILGVCMTESKADELIESDMHKDDHPLMNKNRWFGCQESCYETKNSFINNEITSPKRGGFLNKIHYSNLNKVSKLSYDYLKEKYEGKNLTIEVWREMSDIDEFRLFQILGYYTDITFEEYKELDDWYSTREHSEDPEDIYYDKERFEVL